MKLTQSRVLALSLVVLALVAGGAAVAVALSGQLAQGSLDDLYKANDVELFDLQANPPAPNPSASGPCPIGQPDR